MEVQLGRRPERDHALVTKYAAAQVKYYQSKYGVYFKSYNVPINTITIDENKMIHGYMVSNVLRASTTTLQTFADSMKGIMAIHLVHVRTMKAPVVIDLN